VTLLRGKSGYRGPGKWRIGGDIAVLIQCCRRPGQPVEGAGHTPQHDGQVDEALCDQLPEAWPRQARLDSQEARVLYHLHMGRAAA
jgi:hypothetical protein